MGATDNRQDMRGGRALAGAATALAMLTQPCVVAAQEAGSILTLRIENDIFAGLDEQYTNGTYVALTLPPNDLPFWAALAKRAMGAVVEAPTWRASYGLGQSMFTPSDITLSDPPLDDRPYAGLLFGSLHLSADTGDRLDTVALEVGVTGPPSLAEAAQKFIHNDLGLGDPPRGWGTQLDTEIVFRVVYEQARRYGTRLGPAWGGLEVDAIPQITAAAGTLDVSLGGALTVRAGRGLDMDYGVPRTRRSVAPLLAGEPSERMRWNVFAALGGRLVARDLTLDGNTFVDSRSVDSEPFIGDVSLGFAVDLGGPVASYAHILRSPDFDERDDWTQFGSLSLRLPF